MRSPDLRPIRQRLVVAAGAVALMTTAGVLLMRSVPDDASAPLFLLMVIVEVVVAPIPGGAVAYMGAARFGFWQAWPLLYLGNAVGTALVFMLARRLGAPLFQESISPAARQRYDYLLQNHAVLLWAAYSVPVLPVDMLSVLAGISSISTKRFLTIALTAYVIYSGIVAFLGDFAASLVGTNETLALLGLVLLVAVARWVWRTSRSTRGPGAAAGVKAARAQGLTRNTAVSQKPPAAFHAQQPDHRHDAGQVLQGVAADCTIRHVENPVAGELEQLGQPIPTYDNQQITSP